MGEGGLVSKREQRAAAAAAVTGWYSLQQTCLHDYNCKPNKKVKTSGLNLCVCICVCYLYVLYACVIFSGGRQQPLTGVTRPRADEDEEDGSTQGSVEAGSGRYVCECVCVFVQCVVWGGG